MTPEEIQKIVDDRIRQILMPVDRFMSDDEVGDLLRCSPSHLRKLIADGELVEGAHFTGKGKTRLWIRERVERYIETRGNPAQQLKDIKAWKRG